MKKHLFIRFLLLAIVCFLLFPSLVVPAGAAANYVELDASPVEKDLQMLLEPEEYDALILDETMRDDDGGRFLSVIRVLEFGYDAQRTVWDYYGLYLYVYNPSGIPLTSTKKNCVEMYVELESGTESAVVKYPLKLLSFSADNLLYKYEITGLTTGILKAMRAERRSYHIVGMEFQFSEQSSPKDFNVSMEYEFTGFNAGFDWQRTDAVTLHWEYRQDETISIELHPTSWMSQTSAKGEGYKYEVSGVYFAIPNYYLKTYGNWDEELRGLYEVKGSFEEYKVNGLVTDSEEIYAAATSNSAGGIGTLPYQGTLPTHLFSFGALTSYTGDTHLTSRNFSVAYNIPERYVENEGSFFGEQVYRNDFVKKILGLSFVLKDVENDGITGSELLDVWNGYGEKKPYAVSTNFLGADEGRTLGYRSYTITAGQEPMGFVKYDYSQDHPFKAWFMKGGEENDEIAKVEYLQRVDPTWLESLGANKESAVAEKYYIGEADVPGLIRYATAEEFKTDVTLGEKGSTVYLMHFAKTDYYTADVECYPTYAAIGSWMEGNSYYFERTIFDDFDILEFTFRKENGQMTRIPVVASPVDISGSLPPADDPEANPSNPGEGGGKEDDPSWWDKFLEGFNNLKSWAQIITLLLGLALLSPILVLVVKLIGPVFGLLGKGLGAVFRGIGVVVGGTVKGISTLFSAREKTYDAKRKRKEHRQKDEDREAANRERERKAEREKIEQAQRDDLHAEKLHHERYVTTNQKQDLQERGTSLEKSSESSKPRRKLKVKKERKERK